MKRNQIVTVTLLLFFSSFALNAQEKNKKEISTVKFETSIDCENCVNTIMKNIPFEKGVKDVKCDLTTREVTVQYQKDKNKPEQLKRAIEKLGFTAKEVKEKSKADEPPQGNRQ
ncbi:MAG: heavy-metal-associated domain-containing protein [Deltaproteobacteria bacterium]|nr:heavy-metal-associated domain-containing protein [Deltaproteobacteria bacterium]